MYKISNFFENENVNILSAAGPFAVIEYQRDLSVTSSSAMDAFFCSQMNVKKRQLVCDLSKASITTQAGAMQWTVGNVSCTTGVKGVGDLIGKAVRGKMTGEPAIKPEYTGDGTLVLEPTTKHLILMNNAEWGGSVILDDALFLACETRLQHKIAARSNFSSAIAGGEGLFNLNLVGDGIFCIESESPMEELVIIELQNDTVRIDGNMAIAWSGSLSFTVERSGKTLIGSAAAGDGLVNVYRGTGRVVMSPMARKGITKR